MMCITVCISHLLTKCSTSQQTYRVLCEVSRIALQYTSSTPAFASTSHRIKLNETATLLWPFNGRCSLLLALLAASAPAQHRTPSHTRPLLTAALLQQHNPLCSYPSVLSHYRTHPSRAAHAADSSPQLQLSLLHSSLGGVHLLLPQHGHPPALSRNQQRGQPLNTPQPPGLTRWTPRQ